jgi:hypothetical protein
MGAEHAVHVVLAHLGELGQVGPVGGILSKALAQRLDLERFDEVRSR